MSEHSVYERAADPAGMCEMYEAHCYTCNWTGTSTPEQSEAKEHARRHRLATWIPSADDIAWLTGTGRWSQD